MTKKQDSKASTPSHVVNVKGNVIAHHDVIQGNQYIYGDQYQDFRQQVAQIASPQEFVAKLQELQGQIAQVKEQPDVAPEDQEMLQLAAGQVGEVIEEAKKPQPASERISAKLKSAKKVMDSLGEGVKSAVELGTTIAGFGAIALKLFGG